MSELTPEEKRKRSNRNFIIIVGIVLTIAFCCQVSMWLTPDSEEASRPRPTARPQTVEVEYRITGNAGRASTTYENASGNTEQQECLLPCSKIYPSVPRSQFVYISAQSLSDGYRTIKCEILVDGRVVESAESGGEYVIASCSGRAE